MKDLYKRIGSDKLLENRDEIKRLIETLNPQEKKEFSYILLDQQKKRVYDRCYKTIEQIALLRNRLDDSIGDEFWNNEYNDFKIVDQKKEERRREEVKEKVRQNVREIEKKEKIKKIVVRSIIAVVIIALLISNYLYFFQDSADSKSTNSYKPEITEAEDNLEELFENTKDDVANETFDPEINDKSTVVSDSDSFETFMEEHEPLELPKTGFITKQFDKGESPLEILIPPGSANYFIKIEDINYNTIATIFINRYDMVDVMIPAGKYRIKYAIGDDWYGIRELFGPNTSYFVTDETFLFTRQSGYTIELIKQIDGNLGTTTISESNF